MSITPALVALLLLSTPAPELFAPQSGASRQASVRRPQKGATALQDQAHTAIAEQQWETAAGHFDELTKIQPENGGYWFLLGHSWQRAGRLFRAIPAYERASQFAPNRAEALYNLGGVYSLAARYDEAFESLEDARRAGFPGLQQSLQVDSAFEGLREHPEFPYWLAGLSSLGAEYIAPTEFDFMLGDWDVYGHSGELARAYRTFLAANGHVYVEEWIERGFRPGYCMTYFMPDILRWKRILFDQRGGVCELIGHWEDGAMEFLGEWFRPGANRVWQRSMFRPVSNGRMHVLHELSYDGGRTWRISGDTLHVLHGSKEPGTSWGFEVNTRPRKSRAIDPRRRR